MDFSGGISARVSASSTLKSKPPGRYDAKNAFDGDPKTAWVEGVKGTGEDESLLLLFQGPRQLDGFALWPGYTRSLTTFRDNAIPQRVTLRDAEEDLAEPGKRLMSVPLYYRLSAVKGRDGQLRCTTVAKDPLNLSPRLVLRPALAPRVRVLRLEVQALPPSLHRPRYPDLALSEWLPLLRIVDEEHGEIIDLPSPLPSPLREVAELLRTYTAAPPEERKLPLAPDAQLSSVFDLEPTGLPSWARDTLRARLIEKGAAPDQDPMTQFGNAVAWQFMNSAVTVQSLPEGGVLLVGEPYLLSRQVPGTPPSTEKAFVFPTLTLNPAFKVLRMELRTSGLTGEGCEQSLPAR